MPTVSYDFNEAGDFADFLVLEPGKYVFKFKSAEAGKSKAGNPKVIVDLIVAATGSPDHDWAIGGLVRQHMNTTGGASGRFRDFIGALGYNPKEKGSLKLEKYFEKEIGASVIKTVGENTDEAGNPVYFNDLRTLIPGDQMRKMIGALDDDEDEEEEDEIEEEEEDLEDEEEEAEDDEEEDDEEEEDEDDEEEEEDEDDEEEEELAFEDLKSWKLPELKELAKEYDISTRAPKGKKLTPAIMRKRLEVIFEEEEEEGEEDPF